MSERIIFKGKYTVESTNIITGEKSVVVFYNVVTQAFFDSIFKFLNQDTDAPLSDILNITHIAIGDGTTPATRSDTVLASEIFRKVCSSKTYNTQTFTAKLSIGPTEGNPTGGYINEIAVFSKATGTANSGSMISRAIVNIQKNTNIQLLITWALTGA